MNKDVKSYFIFGINIFFGEFDAGGGLPIRMFEAGQGKAPETETLKLEDGQGRDE